MSFRHDKKRGKHPITPKKGIKETDLFIKEKGNNDTIAVSIKPSTKSMKGNREEFGNNLSKEELEVAKEKTKYWSYPRDWITHKITQIRKNEPYLYFNENGVHIMRINDADYGRLLPNEQDFIKNGMG